jgi:uncharacterized membrane protein
MAFILLLSTIGFFVSLYGWYVENKVKKSPAYKPVCDINKKLSCLPTIKSPYSRLLFVSNNIINMIFYVIMFFVSLTHAVMLIKFFSAVAIIPTAFFAYTMYTKIKVLCPLCITLYSINALLFLVSYFL